MMILLFVALLALKLGGVLPISVVGLAVPLVFALVILPAARYAIAYARGVQMKRQLKARLAETAKILGVSPEDLGKSVNSFMSRLGSEDLSSVLGHGIGTSPSVPDPRQAPADVPDFVRRRPSPPAV